MMFLRFRKMPATPMREQDRRQRQIVGKADDHGVAPSNAGARGDFAQFDRRRRRARDLLGDVLPLDADLVAQRQHDRADHRGQQDQSRRLEEVDVVGVEHPAERRGVGDERRPERRRRPRPSVGERVQPTTT